MSTETKQIELVEMTPEEKAEYMAFQESRKKREAEEKKKQDREAYKNLVNETIFTVFPELMSTSLTLSTAKKTTLEKFQVALDMKADIFGVKGDQKSHTFTNDEGTQRITVGNYTTDGYKDTVNEGLAIVREVVESLQTDANSKALVGTIMRLLSKDSKGNLKASKVLELEKTAIELANDRLLEGVNIIKEAYQPAISKVFIRAEYKDPDGAWINIPLGITES